MTENEAKELPKYRPNPIFNGLPDYLKDPKNFKKIEKAILETLAGKCSHGEVIEWATCAKCQRRFAERSAFIQKLGFRSPAQYMAWKKVHEEITRRDPLTDWKK